MWKHTNKNEHKNSNWLSKHFRKKPINIKKHFSRTSSIHSYPTRSLTDQHFSVQNSRLDVQKKAFWHIGIKTQNEILPNDFKMLSKKAFSKKTLKLHYLTF